MWTGSKAPAPVSTIASTSSHSVGGATDRGVWRRRVRQEGQGGPRFVPESLQNDGSGQDQPDPGGSLRLKDALIANVQLQGSNEEPTESVTFAFQSVEIAYKAENDDGSLDAASPKGYDLGLLNADFAAAKQF